MWTDKSSTSVGSVDKSYNASLVCVDKRGDLLGSVDKTQPHRAVQIDSVLSVCRPTVI